MNWDKTFKQINYPKSNGWLSTQMKSNQLKAASVAVIAVIVLSLVPLGKTQDEPMGYTSSFLLLNRPDGDKTYELNITIPQALYQYYSVQNHFTYSDSAFAKFVTPYALKPVADKLWQIYNNTEDFANGVLMLVHQITYQEVVPSKYPVETLVNGYGDCDLFAYIAASILEAGGIPVVLLYYRTQQHMEIGVDLGGAPTETRVQAFSVKVQNVSYFIAECTGSQWRDGWRVGETPSKYQNVSSNVVMLENIWQSPGEQVSASLRELDSSILNVRISSPVMFENNKVTISGQIIPKTANENVTLQAKINNNGWKDIATVETQMDGRFEYNWLPATGGVILIQASWLGNRQYNGAMSIQTNIIVLPIFLIVLILPLVLAVVILLLAFFKTRRNKPKPAGIRALPNILHLTLKHHLTNHLIGLFSRLELKRK